MVTLGESGFHSKLCLYNLYSLFLPRGIYLIYSNSNAITLFIPFPPICSILVFIPLPRCSIYLPGFMSHLRLLIPILLSLHSQFLSLLLVLIQALFSLLWLHANLPALLLYLSHSPTCSQSQSPLFNLSVFSSQCHFPLSFSFSA